MLLELNKLQYPLKFNIPFRFNIYHSAIAQKNIEELYKTISLDNFPLSTRETGSDKTYEVYNKILFDASMNIDFFSQNLSPVWNALLTDLISPRYLESVSESFQQDLTKSHVQIMLKKYEDGGYISMHTDDADVFATHLFFINPYFDPVNGGDLLFHADNKEVMIRLPAFSTISVLFERSECSWHSVEPCHSTISPKVTLQVAFWKKLKKRDDFGRHYT